MQAVAVPNYDGTTWREQSQREIDVVDEEMRIFAQLTSYRNQGFASHWEETSELIAPDYRNTFYYGTWNTPGQKRTDRQIDSTGMLALDKFAAICSSLLTPRDSIYQRLRANDPYVMKDRATKIWFQNATETLFRYRYMPEANFSSQNHANYLMLGAFGNLNMFVDELDDPEIRGLRYNSLPIGEVFYRENHQHRVDGFTRWFKMTARQAHQKWPGMLPPNLHAAFNQQSEWLYNFLHCVTPRDDFDPDRLDAKGKRWRSVYICLEGRCAMHQEGKDFEGGYRTFPLACGRYIQGPNEVYGRGVAMKVLPTLKTLNAQKRMFLKQGHRAADPVLLTYDDGIVGMSLRPGAMNPGGVSADGKLLVHTLPTGDIAISEKMMEEERNIINDGFLVTLFQILVKTPQMSATEVIERANEKGILLAPTIGRQQDEYISPMTDRELDLLMYMRLLPPMPARLQEAQGHYHIVYDNPISRLARAGRSSGFMRVVEMAKEVVAVTQDPSPLDRLDFDTALPGIADDQAVPEDWLCDDKKLAAKRQARQKAIAAEQQMKNLPNQAAMVKAQAVAAKAGMPMQQQQPQQPQLPGPQ